MKKAKNRPLILIIKFSTQIITEKVLGRKWKLANNEEYKKIFTRKVKKLSCLAGFFLLVLLTWFLLGSSCLFLMVSFVLAWLLLGSSCLFFLVVSFVLGSFVRLSIPSFLVAGFCCSLLSSLNFHQSQFFYFPAYISSFLSSFFALFLSFFPWFVWSFFLLSCYASFHFCCLFFLPLILLFCTSFLFLFSLPFSLPFVVSASFLFISSLLTYLYLLIHRHRTRGDS